MSGLNMLIMMLFFNMFLGSYMVFQVSVFRERSSPVSSFDIFSVI